MQGVETVAHALEVRFRWSRAVAAVALVSICVFGSLVTLTTLGPSTTEDTTRFGVWGSGAARPQTGSYQPFTRTGRALPHTGDAEEVSEGAIELRSRLCFWGLLALLIVMLVSYRRERSTRWSVYAHLFALLGVTWCGWQLAGKIESLYTEAAGVYGFLEVGTAFSLELRAVQALLLLSLIWSLWPAASAWFATWRRRVHHRPRAADAEDRPAST